MRRAWVCILMLASCRAAAAGDSGPPRITVGSKSFTESLILGELVAQMASWSGARVQHRRGLGGTKLLWSALLAGQIDIYPEYTGTIAEELVPGADTVLAAPPAGATGGGTDSLRAALLR